MKRIRECYICGRRDVAWSYSDSRSMRVCALCAEVWLDEDSDEAVLL